MNILITGGCGYTGSVLTEKLVNLDHNVIVIDAQWFGNYLKQNKNLKIIQEWWPDALKQNHANPEDHLKFLQHIGYKFYEIDGTIKKDILPITIEQLLGKYPNSLIEDINLFCKKS